MAQSNLLSIPLQKQDNQTHQNHCGKSFIEEVLSIDSVEEYFEHFQVIEIDFTFYRPLLDNDHQPTQNYQVLKTYAGDLKKGDRIILKVPQMITAQKIHRGDQYIENPAYLNSKIFTEQFYELNIIYCFFAGICSSCELRKNQTHRETGTESRGSL
jgi:uncharacterized protein YecE (DUF72 family)